MEPSEIEMAPATDFNHEEDTPIDAALDRIGLGVYQKKLLVLCGCEIYLLLGTPAGLFMFLHQSVGCLIISGCKVLLRYYHECRFTLESVILVLAYFLRPYSGMMCGAWSWGSYSDSFGRRPAFKGTLALASVFGLVAGFAPSFFWLCVAFFFLGVGVGGSMPTDGTLFLENVPKRHHYLLTGLSAFFSIGAVIASLLALWILPSRSCSAPIVNGVPCNVEVDNNGWRLLLKVTAGLTLSMFACRVLFFKLHESPSWLVSAGREQDAVNVLHKISQHNGDTMTFSTEELTSKTAEGSPMLNGHSTVREADTPIKSKYEAPGFVSSLPAPVQNSVSDYLERVSRLFVPYWKKTTLLVWSIWGLVSAAYTIFNAFLPSWLERKSAGDSSGSLESSLQEFLLFTLAGLPGALIGAWLVETPLGRRKAMALSTFTTLLGTLVFTQISSKTAIIISIGIVNLGGTLSYAIIYSYTPETFTADVRGTACGIASAISRATGIVAPLISGMLLSISQNSPLFFSALLFLIAAICMLSLPFEKGSQNR